jgi:putative Mn2+ efflux pump MntP
MGVVETLLVAFGLARDATRGWSLVGLSVATSLDALAVGVGLGILRQRLIRSAVVIGVAAAIMTLVGLQSGRGLRLWVGRRMETVGGLVLIGLAFRMLLI